MRRNIAHVTFLVQDYEEAISFFTRSLAFKLIEDTPLADGKRWVLVAPAEESPFTLLLAKPTTPEQQSRVGDQVGDRVFLFLETDDFVRDHARMKAAGVRFLEAPRHETYGTVAVFEDLYGNKWDLIQPAVGSPAA